MGAATIAITIEEDLLKQIDRLVEQRDFPNDRRLHERARVFAAGLDVEGGLRRAIAVLEHLDGTERTSPPRTLRTS